MIKSGQRCCPAAAAGKPKKKPDPLVGIRLFFWFPPGFWRRFLYQGVFGRYNFAFNMYKMIFDL
jgi:hypothetical protein